METEIKNLHYIDGNILDSEVEYICHQCNCVSFNAAHLAKSIFETYPYANQYSRRIISDSNTKSEPGTIDIFGDGEENRYVINMYAQRYPGRSKYNNDTPEDRLKWFGMCLIRIAQEGIDEIALPYRIGCGAAGGDWSKYENVIKNFAIRYPKINIYLLKFNGE